MSAMIQWAAARPMPSASNAAPLSQPPPWRLKVLQWCRLNGCAWDESTTSEVGKGRGVCRGRRGKGGEMYTGGCTGRVV